MVKKRVGRPRKRGRPKGSRNKIIMGVEETILAIKENKPLRTTNWKIITEDKPLVGLSSRFDECMTRLENAIAEAISKLKEMI